LGPAIVKIGATGDTPSTDLGAIDSVELSLETEGEDVFLGAPRQLVSVLPAQEEATLSVTLFEWDVDNFRRAIGSGTTTATEYAYGSGDVTKDQFALLVQHRILGSGNTFEMRIWQAVPDGDFPVGMDDDVTTFELTFRAIRATTDWAGNTVNEYLKVVEIS